MTVADSMNSSKRVLTKIEVAEAQLKCAITLFFSKADPIPIETLVGAASGVLRGLAKRHGVQAILHENDLINPERKSEWITTLHKEQNYFKHADNDSDQVLEYNPVGFTYLLLEACHLYSHLASDKFLKHHQCYECIVYQTWFSLAHPHLLKDPKEWHAFIGHHLEGIEASDLDFFKKLIVLNDTKPSTRSRTDPSTSSG